MRKYPYPKHVERITVPLPERDRSVYYRAYDDTCWQMIPGCEVEYAPGCYKGVTRMMRVRRDGKPWTGPKRQFDPITWTTCCFWEHAKTGTLVRIAKARSVALETLQAGDYFEFSNPRPRGIHPRGTHLVMTVADGKVRPFVSNIGRIHNFHVDRRARVIPKKS